MQNHTEVELSFKEINLPYNLAYGSVGGASFYTNVNITCSGYEQRNIYWDKPRAQYKVRCDVAEDLAQVITFFRIVQGRAHGFRFKDWTDFNAKDEILERCPADGSIYHFVKSYRFDNLTVSRRIFKPHSEVISVESNGEIMEINFTVDHAIGVVRFAEELPGDAVVKCSFQFDVPVRFDTDSLALSATGFGNHECNDLNMIEIRFHDLCETSQVSPHKPNLERANASFAPCSMSPMASFRTHHG